MIVSALAPSVITPRPQLISERPAEADRAVPERSHRHLPRLSSLLGGAACRKSQYELPELQNEVARKSPWVEAAAHDLARLRQGTPEDQPSTQNVIARGENEHALPPVLPRQIGHPRASPAGWDARHKRNEFEGQTRRLKQLGRSSFAPNNNKHWCRSRRDQPHGRPQTAGPIAIKSDNGIEATPSCQPHDPSTLLLNQYLGAGRRSVATTRPIRLPRHRSARSLVLRVDADLTGARQVG